MKISRIFFLFILAWSASLQAQVEPNTTQVGNWPYFFGYDMVVENKLVYVGNGETLQVYDFSEKPQLNLISELVLPTYPRKIKVRDGIAYILGSKDALFIVDISIPQEPELISSIILEAEFEVMEINGTYVYLLSEDEGIFIVDIANPEVPELADVFQPGGELSTILIAGELAYVAEHYVGIKVYNVSDPLVFDYVSEFHIEEYLSDMFEAEGLLYVRDYFRSFTILDIADPLQLAFISNTSCADRGFDIVVDQNLLATTGSSGIQFYDISNSASPQFLYEYDDMGFHRNVYIDGETILHLNTFSLMVLDKSEGAPLELVNQIHFEGMTHYVSKWGDYVYTTGGNNRLTVLDVSDKENITSVYHEKAEDEYMDVLAQDGLLFLADYHRLIVNDISDPTQPFPVDTLFASTTIVDIKKNGQYLYIADYDSLSVFDLGDLSAPQLIDRILLEARELVIDGNYLYAVGIWDFYLFEISNPADLTLVFSSTNNSFNKVAHHNGYVYLTGDDHPYVSDFSYFIYDVRDLDNIRKVKQLELGGDSYHIQIERNHLYMANAALGILIYELNDPVNLQLVGYYSPFKSFQEFKVYDGIIYTPTASLKLIQNDLVLSNEEYFFIKADQRLKIYPNPTKDFIYIELPEPSDTPFSYTIHNPEGRLFGQGQLGAGMQQLGLSELGSGLYILEVSGKDGFRKTGLILKQD